MRAGQGAVLDHRRRRCRRHTEQKVVLRRGSILEPHEPSVSPGIDSGHLASAQQLDTVLVELAVDVLAGVQAGHWQRHGLERGNCDVDALPHSTPAEDLVDDEDRLERSRRALERRPEQGDEDPPGLHGVERPMDSA